MFSWQYISQSYSTNNFLRNHIINTSISCNIVTKDNTYNRPLSITQNYHLLEALCKFCNNTRENHRIPIISFYTQIKRTPLWSIADFHMFPFHYFPHFLLMFLPLVRKNAGIVLSTNEYKFHTQYTFGTFGKLFVWIQCEL